MARTVKLTMRMPFFKIIKKSPQTKNKTFFQKLLRRK